MSRGLPRRPNRRRTSGRPTTNGRWSALAVGEPVDSNSDQWSPLRPTPSDLVLHPTSSRSLSADEYDDRRLVRHLLRDPGSDRLVSSPLDLLPVLGVEDPLAFDLTHLNNLLNTPSVRDRSGSCRRPPWPRTLPQRAWDHRTAGPPRSTHFAGRSPRGASRRRYVHIEPEGFDVVLLRRSGASPTGTSRRACRLCAFTLYRTRPGASHSRMERSSPDLRAEGRHCAHRGVGLTVAAPHSAVSMQARVQYRGPTAGRPAPGLSRGGAPRSI